MLLAAVLVVVLAGPVYFVLVKNLFSKATKGQLPPGPSTWQILRNILEFRKRPHIAFRDLAQVYGPIMSLRLGGQLVVIASTSAAAKEILKTHDRIFSGRYLPYLYYKIPQAMESSLAMSKECNQTWKFLRRMGQNFIFSSKCVESNAHLRQVRVREMVEYVRSKQGQVVKLDDVMNATITNIISNILFSRNLFDIRGGSEKDDKVRAFIEEVVEMVSSFGLSDLFPILKRVDFWTEWKALGVHRKLKCLWGDLVKERRARRDDINFNSPRDFLDVVFQNGLSDGRIYVLFMELLIGGTDSTSITSVWLMVELIRHPNVLRRVRDEIAKAFEGDMLINETVLTESHYFQCCIKETLRCRNPGPFLVPHRAINTCRVDNYVIPKDSMVLVNSWAVGLDPDSWEDATSFKPERFLDSKIDFKGTNFELIPFSAGRRICPGWNVGLKNIQIMVGSLLHYFDWSLPGGVSPTEIDTSDTFGTTLKKDKPLYLVPRLRE